MKKSHQQAHTIQDFAKKDNESFRKLYHIYFKPLCYFAYNIVQDLEQAEKIANDSLLKIYAFRTTFTNLSSIKSFVYVLARNASINVLKERRFGSIPQEKIQHLTDNEYKCIEEERANGYIMQEVYQQIEGLPKESSEIIKMIFLQGKNTTDIALQMGISHEAAIRQKEKAAQLLRVQLLRKNLSVFYPASKLSAFLQSN